MRLYKNVCLKCQRAHLKKPPGKMPFAFNHRWSNRHVVCQAVGDKVITITNPPPEKCPHKMEHAVTKHMAQKYVTKHGRFPGF